MSSLGIVREWLLHQKIMPWGQGLTQSSSQQVGPLHQTFKNSTTEIHKINRKKKKKIAEAVLATHI